MSPRPRVAILDYGMGNLRSVAKAVVRVGGDAVVTSDPSDAGRADAMVVPGVGAFGACMDGLRERGLDHAVLEFAEGGRPLLGVCLGLQVLFERSEEGDVAGLGILRGTVVRLPSDVKVPHMGWNDVTWKARHPFAEGLNGDGRFYFVHSYACLPEDDVTVGETEHGMRFAAAVGRGNLFGTQFHPEKSGDAGLRIYENLVKAAA
ncbi:MAG: imidazole glycerol phosphate synthase subunit HisH [Actinomycetota bacterium]